MTHTPRTCSRRLGTEVEQPATSAVSGASSARPTTRRRRRRRRRRSARRPLRGGRRPCCFRRRRLRRREATARLRSSTSSSTAAAPAAPRVRQLVVVARARRAHSARDAAFRVRRARSPPGGSPRAGMRACHARATAFDVDNEGGGRAAGAPPSPAARSRRPRCGGGERVDVGGRLLAAGTPGRLNLTRPRGGTGGGARRPGRTGAMNAPLGARRRRPPGPALGPPRAVDPRRGSRQMRARSTRPRAHVVELRWLASSTRARRAVAARGAAGGRRRSACSEAAACALPAGSGGFAAVKGEAKPGWSRAEAAAANTSSRARTDFLDPKPADDGRADPTYAADVSGAERRRRGLTTARVGAFATEPRRRLRRRPRAARALNGPAW